MYQSSLKVQCSKKLQDTQSIYWVYQGSFAFATLSREIANRSFDKVHP